MTRNTIFIFGEILICQYLFNYTHIKVVHTDNAYNDTHINAIHTDYSLNDTR